MNLKSICDRRALRSLSRWRLRLKEDLRAELGGSPDAATLDPESAANLPHETRHALNTYEALRQEIAEQNCRRQCALVEHFKGEGKVPLKLKEEMAVWWWQRY